jgi:phosphohistidine phosphatase
MARQLWLLRHGDAEPHGARPDADRRLTERGVRQARAAGKALAVLGVEFEAVLTSPKVRAAETARLVAEALDAEPEAHEALAAGFLASDALELLAGLAPEGRLLIVGHEPDFSGAVGDLTGARIDLKKGGLAAVRVEGAGGELLLLERPRELARIAGTQADRV